ncbi:thrombospondin type-1 domain-containing protein 1 isoform 2-T2 [Anomaloglossus baeobatrachus]|uniref:thrombospondin type-1 domain-containing protein 1 isoform X2 n=1 Tax=Anomaloglossus baeobatrachus TaxID=238106 RepID=UPI003F4FA148
MRLSSFSYLSLLLVWDSVFSEPGYLLLKQSHHKALSKSPVYVDFSIQGNYSSTNVSVTLLDVKSNQMITSKELPANQSQGELEFECIHFISVGIYQFQMNLEAENDSSITFVSSLLNVTWPIFHIDLNRTIKDTLRFFQIGVFTNEQLCSGFPNQEPILLLEVEHTHSFQEIEEPSADRFMLYKTYKEVLLSSSQWVEFECASVRPEAFITVSLKTMLSESVIAHMGPVDLVKTFKYKLVTMMEKKCDTSLAISIIAPPCNYAEGKLIVYKESPRSPGEGITTIAESALQKGDKSSHFNCTLFEIGKNKYCFEFLVSSTDTLSNSVPRAKQCVEIRREIETWSMWQPWSSCSVTCGDGHRERYRSCLSSSPVNAQCNGNTKETSLCSLEDCLLKPSSKSTTNTNDNPKTSNTVTITGISLCLFIIFITIVITVWRRFTKAGKCSTAARHSSSHSASCRKNSDEENIYQVRESFSDAGDGQQESMEEEVHIPLNYRQSTRVTEDENMAENDCTQPNSQKLIPPIFGYRLAQQQLKEMKQKGLKEATKVYHVSQNPMADTAVDVSLAPPLVPENVDEMAGNKFRIQSPFLEAKNNHIRNASERHSPRSIFSPTHGPSQTLPKISHVRNSDAKGRYDRGYQKNNFRRTCSFHETKHIKPYRERSLTSLTPRQTMVYNSRSKMWEYSTVDRVKHKPARLERSPENLTRGISFPLDATAQSPKSQYLRPGESKPDLVCSRYTAGKSKPERSEQNRIRKGPSPVEKSWNQGQEASPSPNENYQRNPVHSPTRYRREKCQSFPWGNEYSFYDNSTFRLTDAEQQMLDLPGYFASNEEDDTSTLSIERLVL